MQYPNDTPADEFLAEALGHARLRLPVEGRGRLVED